MNNGQHAQSQSSDPFTNNFTAGVGEAPADSNPLQPEDNLDFTDFMPDRDPSNLGNAALGTSGEKQISPTKDITESNTNADTGELGKIINFPMPPRSTSTNPANAKEQPREGESTVKPCFFDGKFNEKDLSAIKEAEQKLSQTSDTPDSAADFYEFRREASKIIRKEAA